MLRNYIKVAWKVLGRNKFFTFVSLFGISFTLAILIVVIALLNNVFNPSYPEPFRDRTLYADRVQLQDEEKQSSSMSASGFHFVDEYLKKMETPEKVGLLSAYGGTSNVFLNNRKLTLERKYTDDVIWEIFDYEFVEGKPYNASNIANNDYVAVITENTRDDYFGVGQSAIGKNIILDNLTFKVIGVIKNVPKLPPYPFSDVFLPYYTSIYKDHEEKDFLGGYIGVILAKNKRDFPAIKKEFHEIVDRIEIPEDEDLNIMTAWINSQKERISGSLIQKHNDEDAVKWFYGVLLGGMLLFTMLPTLNLININTSRIMERASEIGVRKAFGATSSTLARQFIVENIILTLIGGAIGLVLAYGIIQFIEGSGLIEYSDLKIDLNVFLFAILLCFIFGFLSGVLPAIRMSRLQVVNAIKGEIK